MSETAPSPHEDKWDERIAQRADTWQIRDRRLALGPLPLLMGILNVTPDSFSDGGSFFDAGSAIKHGLALVDQGADILDIGGESTRPYSRPIDAAEESRRVIPVVRSLAQQCDIPISIDTSKASVAAEAIAAGASIINDVTGLEGDAQMVNVARESLAGVCVMHMQGTPQTMQDDPAFDDVVVEVMEYLGARRDALVAQGCDRHRICLDVGLGFGKTHQHNLQLLGHMSEFHLLGCPILVGHSRKGFLAKIMGDRDADRTPATIGVGLAMAVAGVQILRVHDVRSMRAAMLAFATVGDFRRN